MSNEIIKIDPVMIDLVHSSQIQQSNPFTEEIFLTDILVAGVQQEGWSLEYVKRMNPGDELEMVRTDDGQNPFHIWLTFEGSIMGEVPVENGVILARLMDAGKKLKCKVNVAGTYTSEGFTKPFTRILAKIYLVD